MQATCSNAPNAPKDPSIRSNTTQLPPKSENQNPAGPTLHAPIFFSHSPVFSAQLLPRTLQYSFSQGNTQKSHHHGTRSRTNCCPKACAPLPATGVIWLIWAFDVVIGRMPFLSGIVSDFFASNGLCVSLTPHALPFVLVYLVSGLSELLGQLSYLASVPSLLPSSPLCPSCLPPAFRLKLHRDSLEVRSTPRLPS